MHMDMSVTMCMHMRMGANTVRDIALGTETDLEFSPYEHNDGYGCGHAFEYTYAYAYAHGHAQWHGYGHVCAYGYACESMGQGDETCHLISLRARAEYMHRRGTAFNLPYLQLIPHPHCHSHPSPLSPSNNPTLACPFLSHIIHIDIPRYW